MGTYIPIRNGEVFGYLTVIRETEKPFNANGRHFLCTCKHDHRQILPLYRLRELTSCKSYCEICVNEGKVIPGKVIIPVVGEKYGVWTVLSRIKYKGHNTKSFMCECECGEKKSIMIRKILAVKGSPMCSLNPKCRRKEAPKLNNRVDEIKYQESCAAVRYVNAEREREGKKK